MKWYNQSPKTLEICTSNTNQKRSLNLNTSIITGRRRKREYMTNLYLALLNLINHTLMKKVCLMPLNKCFPPLVSVSPEKSFNCF